MDSVVHITEASRHLGVTPHYLRMLEAQGRIPAPRRDLNGRIYSEDDLSVLRSIGVGSRPRRLLPAEKVLEDSRG